MVKGIAHSELAHVELAQQHCPRFLQPRHDGGVVIRHIVFQDGRPSSGEDAVGAELVLHRDGHSMKRAAMVARGDLGLGLARLGPGLLGGNRDV